MAMCYNNPHKAKGKCPPKSVAKEYMTKEKEGEMKPKLKPCPFCGGKAKLTKWEGMVYCTQGGCVARTQMLFGRGCKKKAAKRWNRRAKP